MHQITSFSFPFLFISVVGGAFNEILLKNAENLSKVLKGSNDVNPSGRLRPVSTQKETNRKERESRFWNRREN